jgi:hypothetical protein
MSIERAIETYGTVELDKSNKSIMGWEDVAIVIKDTQYSATDDLISFESSHNYQKQIDPIMFKDGSCHHATIGKGSTIEKNSNVAIPKSIPVGSSDDSCCSDSTESSISSSCCNGSLRSNITNSCDGNNENFGYSTDDLPQRRTKSLEQNNPNTDVSSAEVDSLERIQIDTVNASKPKVKFCNVRVREYALVLGDHPYCAMYPLSLDWNYVDVFTTTMEDFEENHRRRIPNETRVHSPVVARKILKKGKGLNSMVNVRARKLSVMDRMSLLLEFSGYTSQQLYQVERKRQLMAQDEKLLYGINTSLTLI